MPQVPRAQLASALAFNPEWIADPGPEIWALVGGLSHQQQVTFAQAVLGSRISVAEAHVQGMKDIHTAIGGLQQGG